MNCREPHMTAAERELLAKVTPVGGKVLEFGSGGSTGFFFDQGAAVVVSVDSDKDWLMKMAETPFLADFIEAGRWLPLHANIGKVEKWGNPEPLIASLSWLNYHQEIWTELPFSDPDLVLIDGRFRVACLCQTLLNCDNDNVGIFMHDFWAREHYHSVLAFTSVQARADGAVLLRKRPETNWRSLCQILLDAQFDHR